MMNIDELTFEEKDKIFREMQRYYDREDVVQVASEKQDSFLLEQDYEDVLANLDAIAKEARDDMDCNATGWWDACYNAIRQFVGFAEFDYYC